MRAIRPAHSGATALVPPTVPCCPSARIWYPVAGSALPATSGTPRPIRPPGFTEGGTLALACQVGRSMLSLMPPPVAPPLGPSFQTVSLVMLVPEDFGVVPPRASTKALEAGKSQWARPSSTWSREPSSPAAQQIVTPMAGGAGKAFFPPAGGVGPPHPGER